MALFKELQIGYLTAIQIEQAADEIARRVVRELDHATRTKRISKDQARILKDQAYPCAFHHALDLIKCVNDGRRTTRTLPGYETNAIEESAEYFLSLHYNIKRAARKNF